jgi:hypothetical protein
VIAAGGVCRIDVADENQLYIPAAPASALRPYDTGVYRGIDRIVQNNLVYIGNLFALRAWYRTVRTQFLCRDAFDKACLEGGLKNINLGLAERIKRLGGLANKMPVSFQSLEKQSDAPSDIIAAQRRFCDSWGGMELELKQADWQEDAAARDTFLSAIENMPVGGAYTESIQSLNPAARLTGQSWLQSIVDGVAALWPPQSH